jgi:multisubunit Na+/H+ antiporter MnhC subunit
MNWKNEGVWLLLLIPIIGLSLALKTNMSRDIVSLLLLATLAILFIIRWKWKHTHKD